MQYMLDHMVATIVTGMIVLMLFSLKLRTQDVTVDALNHYAQTTQELNFIEMLKRDLHGVATLENVTEVVVGSDTSFSFRAQLDHTDTTKSKITYKRKKVGERDGMPHYQIQRYEEGSFSGASMITVTAWKIQARNEEGGSIQNPKDAVQIYVQFEAAAPIRENTTLNRTRWEATFHPPLLQKNMVI